MQQLLPPHNHWHNHRPNAARRAICIFKNYFIAGIVIPDLTFWARECTYHTQHHPSISSQSQPFWPCLSLWPIRFQSHATSSTRHMCCLAWTPQQWGLREPHRVEGWYTSPAMERYCCITCYIPSTYIERHVDTIIWFSHIIPLPTTSTNHYLYQAASGIIALFRNPAKHPMLQYDTSTADAIFQVASFLHRAALPPSPVPLSNNNVYSAPRVDRAINENSMQNMGTQSWHHQRR